MKHVGHPLYFTWQGMKRRCYSEKDPKYPAYGGRGIVVCMRWASFEQFVADMGPRPVGLTLDRRDNDGPYAKWNCRWATSAQQSKNRRNTRWFDVEEDRLTTVELCERFDLNRRRIDKAILRGVTPEQIVADLLRG